MDHLSHPGNDLVNLNFISSGLVFFFLIIYGVFIQKKIDLVEKSRKLIQDKTYVAGSVTLSPRTDHPIRDIAGEYLLALLTRVLG